MRAQCPLESSSSLARRDALSLSFFASSLAAVAVSLSLCFASEQWEKFCCRENTSAWCPSLSLAIVSWRVSEVFFASWSCTSALALRLFSCASSPSALCALSLSLANCCRSVLTALCSPSAGPLPSCSRINCSCRRPNRRCCSRELSLRELSCSSASALASVSVAHLCSTSSWRFCSASMRLWYWRESSFSWPVIASNSSSLSLCSSRSLFSCLTVASSSRMIRWCALVSSCTAVWKAANVELFEESCCCVCASAAAVSLSLASTASFSALAVSHLLCSDLTRAVWPLASLAIAALWLSISFLSLSVLAAYSSAALCASSSRLFVLLCSRLSRSRESSMSARRSSSLSWILSERERLATAVSSPSLIF
mmetsp:Transcript_12139/g.48827  ORF Transcript_12139/g.48827 Transcript_12139/m.48827 type:complete len:368 (-) Transcript_12139:68-1171(-)